MRIGPFLGLLFILSVSSVERFHYQSLGCQDKDWIIKIINSDATSDDIAYLQNRLNYLLKLTPKAKGNDYFFYLYDYNYDHETANKFFQKTQIIEYHFWDMFKAYAIKKILIQQKDLFDLRNNNQMKGYSSFEGFIKVFSKEVKEAIDIFFITQLRPPPKENDEVGQAWHRLYQTILNTGPDMRVFLRDALLETALHLPYTITNPFYNQEDSEFKKELLSSNPPNDKPFSIQDEIDKTLYNLEQYRKLVMFDIRIIGQFKYCLTYNLNEYLYDVMVGTIKGDQEKINIKFMENVERLSQICELMEYKPSFEEHFWAFFEFYQKLIMSRTINLKTFGVDYFMKGLGLILEFAERKGFGFAAMRFMITMVRARSISLGLIDYSFTIPKEDLLKSLPYTYQSTLPGPVLEMMIFDILTEGSQNPSQKLVNWFPVARAYLPYVLFIEDQAIKYLNGCRKNFINYFDVGSNFYAPFTALYYFLLEHYEEFRTLLTQKDFEQKLDEMIRFYPDRQLNYMRSLIRIFLAAGARTRYEMLDLEFDGFEYTVFEKEWEKQKMSYFEDILKRITSPAQGGLFYRFQDPGVCHVKLLKKIKVFSDMFEVPDSKLKRQILTPKQYEFKNHRISGF